MPAVNPKLKYHYSHFSMENLAWRDHLECEHQSFKDIKSSEFMNVMNFLRAAAVINNVV